MSAATIYERQALESSSLIAHHSSFIVHRSSFIILISVPAVSAVANSLLRE
jgi:hypothetical protein